MKGHHCFATLTNSSGETSAWRSNPARVPTLTSLCIGTTHPFVPRRMMTWLPDWRTFTNPRRSSALTIVAPDVLGSLGTRRDAERCDNRMSGCGQWKFGKIQRCRFFEIRDGLLDSFPLRRRARFGVQRDISTFFSRRKNGGEFHGYTSIGKEANCRAFEGLMPNVLAPPLPGPFPQG